MTPTHPALRRRRTAARALGALLPLALLAALASPSGEGAKAPAVDAELSAATQVPPPLSRPNILIVMTDDQPVGMFKTMPKTLKWFADKGTTFRNAFATTPNCCPSRATIFTGQYAHNHGVRTSFERDVGNLDHDTTIQRYLKDAGYRTAVYGKYLNRWPAEQEPPYFDDFAIMRKGYRKAEWNVNGRVLNLTRYTTDFIRKRALRFLASSEEEDGRPWFMVVTPFAPHPPQRSAERHGSAPMPDLKTTPAIEERVKSDKPPYVQDSQIKFWRARREYRRMERTLLAVDELVASLRKSIEDKNESARTLAFYASDNGYLLGEHGLRGKAMPYKRSVRIPMMMRWPGRVKGGTVDHRLVANIDVAPTIAAAAGVVSLEEMDGRNLLDDWTRKRILTEVFGSYADSDLTWASTITKKYQYVEYYVDTTIPSQYEYYNLERDPWQLKNLLGDRSRKNDPPRWSAKAVRLKNDRNCSGADCP